MVSFLEALASFGIKVLADIRSLPGSRKYPQFDKENLEQVLPESGIKYVWFPKLGGLRKSAKGFDSPNKGLTSPSFRSYADYMLSEDFQSGVGELLEAAEEGPLCYMCAEALFWRCHRRLVSDYLFARDVKVLHIMGKKTQEHTLTEGAVITDEKNVIYMPVHS